MTFARGSVVSTAVLCRVLVRSEESRSEWADRSGSSLRKIGKIQFLICDIKFEPKGLVYLRVLGWIALQRMVCESF